MVHNWEKQIKKVILPYLILKQISIKPQYGYYILKMVNEKNNLNIADGTLYPILTRLAEKKLVTYEWVAQKDSSSSRKYYTLTPEGRSTLNLMRRRLKELEEVI